MARRVPSAYESVESAPTSKSESHPNRKEEQTTNKSVWLFLLDASWRQCDNRAQAILVGLICICHWRLYNEKVKAKWSNTKKKNKKKGQNFYLKKEKK